MPEREHYLTVEAAAEYLGVCPNTLCNWGAAGRIPMCRHRLNSHQLFQVHDPNKPILMAERAVSKRETKQQWRLPR